MDHITRRISATKVSDSPFAHFLVEDVFPDDVYREILENLPSFDRFHVFSETGRVNADYNRNRLFLSSLPDDLMRLDEKPRAFWKELFAVVGSQEILNCLFIKFGPYLHARLQARGLQIAAGNFDVGVRVSLVRDRTGFELGPHTDSLSKLLSGLFYLPADEANVDLGTSLYLPTNRDFKCVGSTHHGFERFERVMTAAYKPNSFFMFVKSDVSFHGVEKVERDVSRDIMFLDILGIQRGQSR
jgi:hypothetical protein